MSVKPKGPKIYTQSDLLAAELRGQAYCLAALTQDKKLKLNESVMYWTLLDDNDKALQNLIINDKKTMDRVRDQVCELLDRREKSEGV